MIITFALPFLYQAQILFNCPKASDLKSNFVKTQFNIIEFARNQTYYEIAYKDVTQPRICKCITSRKLWVTETKQIQDAFTIECAGKPYHSELVFNQSTSVENGGDDDKGTFVGVWNQQGVPILSSLRFPDSVVDVGVSARSDGSLNYDWSVEFQCNEGPGRIVLFYAFNFYSSTNDLKYFDSMKASLLNAGLERFLVKGNPIQMVNHKDCCTVIAQQDFFPKHSRVQKSKIPPVSLEHLENQSTLTITFMSLSNAIFANGSVLQVLLTFFFASWIFMMFFIISGPILLFYRYYYAKKQYPEREELVEFKPTVAILRPLKGLDVNLEGNLESSFLQDYDNFEIIFSVATTSDPAFTVVQKLASKYPSVKCSIIVGLSNVGINPKVNNLIKGFHQTKAEIVWILDSNAYVEPGSLRRAIHCFRNPKVGLVHHVPCGVELSSFGAYLDSGFLNCNHARMYSVINSLGVASCIIGKSNLFRKTDLLKIGGLEEFGKYMAEDNMIGVALMNLGRTHQIAPDFVYQSMGSVTVTNFLMRRIRWLRIRKYAVMAATIYEPFSECLLSGILAGLSFQRFYGIDFYLFNLCHWIVWFFSDMFVASMSSGSLYGHTLRDFPQFVLGWLVLQIIVLPSYIYAMAGDEIKWRNQKYLLKSDGTCMVELAEAKEGKVH